MIKAKFIERINRFTALVELNRETVSAHVANSGRLRELFVPGAEIYLTEIEGAHRATRYDLSLVKYKGKLVSVDARIPNKVVADAVNNRELNEFAGYRVFRREVKFGDSRLDLLLHNESGEKFFVEVKSSTLVIDGNARFPDAPTERGARHVSELIRARAEGNRAAVVFLIQREDPLSFTPNDSTDPEFGEKLREAYKKGVEIYAFKCRVSCNGINIIKAVPVIL